MTGADFTQDGSGSSAVSGGIRAAGMEPAARRRVNRVAYFASQDGALSGSTRLGARHSGKERFSIWVRGAAEYLLCLTHFHYFTQVHHGNMGSYVLEHG